MRKLIATGIAAVAAALALVPAANAEAAAHVERCAWWNLKGTDELVIDGLTPKTSCKAAKAVGNSYLKAHGWHPATLRAAGKTWHRIDQEGYNGGDDCAEGRTPLGGGPYFSYKTTTYAARTRAGRYSVHLTYQWELEDQENCSG